MYLCYLSSLVLLLINNEIINWKYHCYSEFAKGIYMDSMFGTLKKDKQINNIFDHFY